MALEFRRCDVGRPPASEPIDAVLAEYDSGAGRALRGGPSATPSDFSPPGGAFVLCAATAMHDDADIAGELFLGLHAVRERLARLEAKLGVYTAAEAIARARRESA